jgi:hypothetical protein
MEEILKNGALHCRFLLMFALFDPPPAPFPAPSWSQAGPGRSSGMCISHVGAHARARAHARAPARTRARAFPRFRVRTEGGEGGFCTPLSLRLSLRRTASQHIKDMLGC